MRMLEQINHPNDIKKIPVDQLPQLAADIRRFLIDSISKTGGHLASNLGAVELTMALHYVYDLPEDKIVWDVGHQCYTHKILTGRRDDFASLREEGGISGFPRRAESPCDTFDGGHSSTSLSAGLGYVKARDLLGKKYHVVSVIGDGAFTGGMAYEAINNAANLKSNFTIVLNDNAMSISKNVGGISEYLSTIRTSPKYTGLKDSVLDQLEKIPELGDHMVERIRRTKSSLKHLVIPGMFFEDMGIMYLGPVDGHNIRNLIRVLSEAKRYKGTVLVHVITEKGKGYQPAVSHPDKYHGTGAFDVGSGMALKHSRTTYTDVFAASVRKLGTLHHNLVGITAAMGEGTGLEAFEQAFPERYFDVGIAEEHAVTFAAGLALGGMIPVFAVYSAFLQRAYDQIMDDVCMQKLHVIFAIDRAGFVGADGRTHNGVYDLSYLTMIPGMTVLAPKNAWELEDMFDFAVSFHGPVAIRYPRGQAYIGLKEERDPIRFGKAELIHRGKGAAILAIGSMVEFAAEVSEKLIGYGIDATVVNLRFASPLDYDLIRDLASEHSLFLTVEENCRKGGVGEQILDFTEKERLPVHVEIAAVPDRFIPHATVGSQRRLAGLDVETLTNRILQWMKPERMPED